MTDAVYDAARNRVYATVASTDPSFANRLVSFDPTDGRIVASVFVGSEPDLVALSEDGSTIWVGLSGSNSVAEIDRASFTVSATLSLHNVDPEEVRAVALEPIPGNPDAVAVTLDYVRFSSTFGVGVVEDGALLPDIEADSHGAQSLAAVSPTRIVGYNSQSTGYQFYRFDVSATGVTAGAPALSTAIRGFHVQIAVFDGRVYASNGAIIDPENGEALGHLDLEFWGATAPVVADGYAYIVQGFTNSLEIFDTTSFIPQGEPLSFFGEVTGLLLTDEGLLAWGPNGFETGQQPTGVVGGVVLDDITGVAIDNLCVDAYEAGDLTFTAVGTASTSSSGRWELTLPGADYWFLYYECEFLDYFSEWHGGAVPAAVNNAFVVSVDPGTVNYGLVAELRGLFTDVPRDAFYFLPTAFLWHAGITNGCGLLAYCPNDFVTREQMAAFMARFWRLFDRCSDTPSPFVDVNVNSFAYWDVGCIADLGVTKGTGPGTYSPGDVVTREQMGAFIARLWRAFGFDCPTGAMPFTDVSVTSFAHNDILCIYLLGITTGTSPTTYSPADGVTRAQMAAFLERLFDAVTVRLEEIEGQSLAPAFADDRTRGPAAALPALMPSR